MLDIIIVNYNSTNHLLNCLKSLETELISLPADIFIQDNASTDGIERVLTNYPKVHLTKNPVNLGFARAVNQALRQSSNEFVLLLNPDTHVESGLVETLIQYMEHNPDVGILGPKILDRDSGLQNSARAFPTPLTAFFGRTSFLTKWFPDNPITSRNLLSMKSDGISPMEVDWVSGACMVIRKKAIEDVGLMDERFFMYWEDADWCKRMWLSGWKVVYVPQACVFHFVGGSSDNLVYRSTIEFHRSVYHLFNKHVMLSFPLAKLIVYHGLLLRLLFLLLSHSAKKANLRINRLIDGKKHTDTAIRCHKIRVLRVISRLNIGGPAIHVHLLTEGLDRERFETALIAGVISPQEGDMSYLFETSLKKPMIIAELQREINLPMDIKVIPHIFKLLRQKRPDVVHTHTAKAGMSARVAVFLYNLLYHRKVRTVHTFHGHVFEGYFSKAKSKSFLWIERLLSRTTDVIIAISQTQHRDLSSKYRIAPLHKIKTVRLGFELGHFLQKNPQKGAFRQELGVVPSQFLIGIVGRLVPIKNHLMFLKAAKVFIEQNPTVNVKFVVIGDGELRDQLKAYCTQTGMSRYVFFCGWIKDISTVYADLDILALTSLNEGTPVSIIEAMASSVPVISTDVGGVADLLGAAKDLSPDGFKIRQRGILCEKDDLYGFASGLKYLVDINGKNREMLIADARAYVEQAYSKDRLIEDMETLYTQLVTKDSKRS